MLVFRVKIIDQIHVIDVRSQDPCAEERGFGLPAGFRLPGPLFGFFKFVISPLNTRFQQLSVNVFGIGRSNGANNRYSQAIGGGKTAEKGMLHAGYTESNQLQLMPDPLNRTLSPPTLVSIVSTNSNRLFTNNQRYILFGSFSFCLSENYRFKF